MSNSTQPPSPTMTFDFQASDNTSRQKATSPKHSPPLPKISHVIKLLALAHHFEHLLNQGVAKDYADLARLGGVTRARITQIMDLLLLAPVIQKQLLLAKPGEFQHLTERKIRKVVKESCWEKQTKLFEMYSKHQS